MSEEYLKDVLQSLSTRGVAGGGFAGQPAGQARPDATALAVLARRAWGQSVDELAPDLNRLAASQLADGRVAMLADYPQAFWPTADAILAWHGSSAHESAQKRAIDFLLRTTGHHFKKNKAIAAVVGHDTSIKGWPWIENTHSWVEPTSMNLLALEAIGQGGHPRAEEARRMLVDRQLESGGWNYGNTTTYCLELRPSMESTGMALHALAGYVPQSEVERSIDYLERDLPKTRTPLWLGWALLGLNAWGRNPPDAQGAIAECLQRQPDYGSYDTAWIAILLLAAVCPGGLVEQVRCWSAAVEVA